MVFCPGGVGGGVPGLLALGAQTSPGSALGFIEFYVCYCVQNLGQDSLELGHPTVSRGFRLCLQDEGKGTESRSVRTAPPHPDHPAEGPTGEGASEPALPLGLVISLPHERCQPLGGGCLE